ncbi:MAG: hypothetical protein R6V67_08885, partial [Spirochaetia bacterium]
MGKKMKPVPRIVYYLLGVLVLWFPSVPLLALDAPTQVNDGTGSDIDYTNNTSSYSANWDQIDWSSASQELSDGDTLRYDIYLLDETGSRIDQAGGSTNSVDYSVGRPSTTFSNVYFLTENVEYS